ncbi:pancreatic lipase-related protein 2-like isoform X2 [Orbicella faveolata]|uniref:pancreatic lipase-related protein 2-like isoform X2 n=1 Tax=Orbicella faveolata TaxID=48498 RepID=UPI0009E33B87|nr:pancreatic lipase-related protein 2-like isoform X2 [Orbicella faveolata]
MKPVVLFLCITMSALAQGWLFPKPEVCFNKYGCFKKTRVLAKLPQDPSVILTKFHLFTRGSSQSTLIDDNNQAKLRASNFKIAKRTIFVIHGFLESIKTWAQPMKDALLEREDCNVILVDWSKGAGSGPLDYAQASGNARLVGAQTAVLIKFLISSATGSSGSKNLGKRFYIVGFSLGAHVAGYAGRHLQANNGIKLGRITGLDPAGPLHINVDADLRLDKNDADQVDVIHTDTAGFGTKRAETVGHIDFFPNGGDKQPGCDFDIQDVVSSVSCDHMRATEYYIASVGQCSWKTHPCKSYNDCRDGKTLNCPAGGCPSMGFDADSAKHAGRFYLQTKSKAPFC